MNMFSKDQCRHKDWNNVKEIHTKDIADCIHRHKFDVNEVPNDRLRAVIKELEKLQIHDKEKQEKKAIEEALAIYKYIDDGTPFGNTADEIVGYYLDPDLFETSWEVTMAISEISSLWNQEITKIEEYNHNYKNTDTYSRDIKRMKKAMKKVKKQYVTLGGVASLFDKGISQIPMPTLNTLKQDTLHKRINIKQKFIDAGVMPTRADSIAIAITEEVYHAL